MNTLNKIMRVGMTLTMVLIVIFGLTALYSHVLPEITVLEIILGFSTGIFLIGPMAGILYRVSEYILKEYIKLFDDIFKIY